MPDDDKPPTIRELYGEVCAEARVELDKPRRTSARPLAEAWTALDAAMRRPDPGGYPEPMPEGWGERLPAGHYPAPDGTLSVNVAEPALIYFDGEGATFRLDRGERWLAPPGRRARAILRGMLELAGEDVAGLGNLCGASGAAHRIYETCDRAADHGGDLHTAGTYSWQG